MQERKESKLLERAYVELEIPGKAGTLSRKEAIAAAAIEFNVAVENVALVRLQQQSGTRDVVGKFYLYEGQDSKKRIHPPHLGERLLTKEERQKLRQDRKKAATPAPAPEAKK